MGPPWQVGNVTVAVEELDLEVECGSPEMGFPPSEQGRATWCSKMMIEHDLLVGRLVAIFFFYFPRNIGNFIIPIDICFRGGQTTNQLIYLTRLFMVS